MQVMVNDDNNNNDDGDDVEDDSIWRRWLYLMGAISAFFS